MNSIDFDGVKPIEKTENGIFENDSSPNESLGKDEDRVPETENIDSPTPNKSLEKDEDRVPEMENIDSPICVNETNSNENLESSVTNDKTENDKSEPDEWLDILGSGQLKKKILKPGKSGEKPPRNGICRLNIVSALEDGTVVEEFKDLTIQVGDFEVIQGLDLTIPLMEIGETCLLEVGPRFAYGVRGREPDIPSNATLIYTVELISAEEEPELNTLPSSELKKRGNKKRECGNWWFSRDEYTLAIQCYRRALDFLDDVEGGINIEGTETNRKLTKEELTDLLEDRLKVYNNLAIAQMKIKSYDAALSSLENVLRCQPDNVKALYRKGKSLTEKGEYAQAIKVLKHASSLEPESNQLQQELNKAINLSKRDKEQQKNLYKKMLGQDKSEEKKDSKSSKFPWLFLGGSVIALVGGLVAYRFNRFA